MKSRNLTIVGLAMTAILLGSCDEEQTQQEIYAENAKKDIPELKKKLKEDCFKDEYRKTSHSIGANGTYYAYGDVIIYKPDRKADIYFGSDIDNMQLDNNGEYAVEPFKTYYIKYEPYVQYADDDERHYMDTTVGPLKVIVIPNIKCNILSKGANGDMGSTLKMDVFYGDNDLRLPLNVKTYAKFELNCPYNPEHNYKGQIEFPFGCDSIYIESNKDMPAYSNITKDTYISNKQIEFKSSILEMIRYSIEKCLDFKLLFDSNDTIGITPSGCRGDILLYDTVQYYVSDYSHLQKDIYAYQKVSLGNAVFLNKAKKEIGYHEATNDDWLDYEESLGIEREEDPKTYFCFDYVNNKYQDTIIRHDENVLYDLFKYEDLLKKVNNSLIGQNTYIPQVFEYLIPSYVSYDVDDDKTTIRYYWYATDTSVKFDGGEYTVCRLFINGKDGVLRCLVPSKSSGYGCMQIVQD